MKSRLILMGFICLWLLPGCSVVINPITDMVVKNSDGNIIAHNTGIYDFGEKDNKTSAGESDASVTKLANKKYFITLQDVVAERILCFQAQDRFTQYKFIIMMFGSNY